MNLGTHTTNLKYNEDRFSKCAFLHVYSFFFNFSYTHLHGSDQEKQKNVIEVLTFLETAYFTSKQNRETLCSDE